MAVDGLFPKAFAQIHPKFRPPTTTTLLTGGCAAVLAGSSYRCPQLDDLDRYFAGFYHCLHQRGDSSENQTRARTIVSNSLGSFHPGCWSDHLLRPDAFSALGHLDALSRMVSGRDGDLFRVRVSTQSFKPDAGECPMNPIEPHGELAQGFLKIKGGRAISRMLVRLSYVRSSKRCPR